MLWWKFAKFLISFLKTQVIFPSNFPSVFTAIKHNSFILFLAQTLYNLFKSIPLKCKFLRFSSAQVKIHQIPHVNFKLTSQFLFKFCIILHCHDTKLPRKFQVHTFSSLDKRIPSKSQCLDFRKCSGDILLNSSCCFWKHKSVFLQMLHHYSVASNINVLYFFLAQTIYTLVKRSPLKCKFLKFPSHRIKICQIPHVNFELTSQFLFKFCIILPCHDTKLHCNF